MSGEYEGFAKMHLPCPCGDSSDAYSVNSDGSGKCFSCDKFFRSGERVEEVIEEYVADGDVDDVITMEYMSHWNISKRTFEFYESPTKIVNGVPVSVGFPYESPIGSTYKVRMLAEKKFFASGPEMRKPMLFGKQFFPKGSKDKIVITEGEKDALAAYEMLLGQAACVSVRGGSSAFADVKSERDYLISFSKIILCLDNDEVGQEAMSKIVKSGIFDYNVLFKAW